MEDRWQRAEECVEKKRNDGADVDGKAEKCDSDWKAVTAGIVCGRPCIQGECELCCLREAH